MPEDIDDKCGLTLAYDIPGRHNVVPLAYGVACHLENRGQDYVGAATLGEGNMLRVIKKEGLVTQALARFAREQYGKVCLIHNRYRTKGKAGPSAAQPLRQKDFVLAHNGQVEDTELQRRSRARGERGRAVSDTDSVGRELQHLLNTTGSMRNAIRELWPMLDGAHNIMTLQQQPGEAYAWRDERGTHPLVFGRVADQVVIASEDNAIKQILGKKAQLRDIKPGEVVRLQQQKEPTFLRLAKATPAHCIFEWWYFAKRLSTLDTVQTYSVRHRAGELLAELDAPLWEELGIEPIVVAVPDSAKATAEGYTHILSLLSRIDAIVKNPKAKRTFIDDDAHRAQAVQGKYIIKRRFIQGEDIVLIEDSVVRSTTLKALIKRIRQSKKPRSTHVRVAFPPVIAPCFYGINMSTTDELWMTQFRQMESEGASTDEIARLMAKSLNVDSVSFLPLGRVAEVLGMEDDQLCHGCTRGEYPTETGQRLYELQLRNAEKKLHAGV